MPARLCCAGNAGARPRCPRMPTAQGSGDGGEGHAPVVVCGRRLLFIFLYGLGLRLQIQWPVYLAVTARCVVRKVHGGRA